MTTTQPKPSITLNGKVFASSAKAMADSQAAGFYRRAGRGVLLHDRAGNRVGGINAHGVLHSSRRTGDGRWWHSYGTPTVVGEYASYATMVEESHRALEVSRPGADRACEPGRS